MEKTIEKGTQDKPKLAAGREYLSHNLLKALLTGTVSSFVNLIP
jgi:hypothetical protein